MFWYDVLNFLKILGFLAIFAGGVACVIYLPAIFRAILGVIFAVAGLPIGAVCGVIAGAFTGVRSFFAALFMKVKRIPGCVENGKEPAFYTYFYKEWFLRIGITFKRMFSCQSLSTEWCASLLSYGWKDLLDTVRLTGNKLEMIGSFRVGYGLTFTGFVAAVSAAVMLPLWAVFTLISIVCVPLHWAISLFFAAVEILLTLPAGYAIDCPSCENKLRLPGYLCNRCHAEHKRLVTGRYGILTRTCACGEKLPCNILSGKFTSRELTAYCTRCGTSIGAQGNQTSAVLPVIGGVSSGKTVFITTAIMTISSRAGNHGLCFEYVPHAGDMYARNAGALRNGTRPMKTSGARLIYSQFYLDRANGFSSQRHMFSLCDASGELFSDNRAVMSRQGLINAAAYILIIDPLSISAFKDELERDGIDISGYGASYESPDVIAGAVANVLGTNKKIPCAVVFTKCDVPTLYDKIGKRAISAELARQNLQPSPKNNAAIQDSLCENFLNDYSEGNFVNLVNATFSEVQYFTCSGLGHNQDGTPFTPAGTEYPVLWAADKACKAAGLDDMWVRRV